MPITQECFPAKELASADKKEAADGTGNRLGAAVRTLLKRRGMKAFELGKKTGISATSISKIINGVSRPRQKNFTRMCQVLCETDEEQRLLFSAFTGTELLDQEPEESPKPPNEEEILRLRAEQYLERKTQSIAFKRSVARELDEAGISYQKDYCEGPYSTDFLIEKGGKRIAAECKFNIHRNLEKSVAAAEILGKAFRCAEVMIVVPFDVAVTSIPKMSTSHTALSFPTISALTSIILGRTTRTVRSK